MVTRRASPAGPILYGLAWTVVAPAVLLWWALATEDAVPLPAIHSPVVGGALAAGGLVLMALGMAALKVHGQGLPMNAYPPPRYVTRGVYGWISHPIYVGFVILAAGVSVAAGSASGLWLVTPAAALALTALVLGYESHDLRRRFGKAVQPPRLALPQADGGTADAWEQASVCLLALLPWLLVYEAIYASTYLLVIATPLLIRDRAALRRFALTGLVATTAVTFIYLLMPLAGAFPSFHMLGPLITVDAWRSRGRAWSAAIAVWAALIAVSTITTGMHSIADVVLAGLLFPVLRRYDAVWEALRRGAERIANSWREWRIGPVRVINHGFYTGAGGALGAWIAGRLAGPELLGAVLLVGIAALVVSVLWAQYVEGSAVLLRPLGFYGGILGGLLAAAVLALAGVNVSPLMGALAVAMPWVQAAGRMRCLVQGCCHGGPAPAAVGIRYLHSRSRVTQIAGLTGVPVYPTQLYSILSNVITGALLYRLWSLGAAPSLVTGLYFLLNSAARFVEESYRSEPQTPVFARLRLYQWLALAGFAAGIGFTMLKSAPPPAPLGAADPRLLAGALLVGVVAWFITGVDFPESNRRFSRLAPADAPPRLLRAPHSSD